MGIKRKYKNKFLSQFNPQNDLEILKQQINFKYNREINNSPVKPPKRRFVYAGLSLAVCLLLIITVCIVMINNSKVLVYKGMEIVEDTKTLSSVIKQDMVNDYIDNDLIDINNEKEIKYFAKKGTEVIVKINLYNPKQYEIESFLINERKYQAFEFLDGSNSTEIFVKFKVQDFSGIESFYIQELKYIDGTKIKIAKYDADRNLRVGITYDKPTIDIINKVINNNTIEIKFKEKDLDKVINDTYKLYLFDAQGIVTKKIISKGITTFTFDKLEFNKEYELVIAAGCDLLDGFGYRSIKMYDEVFKTSSGIKVNDVVCSKRGINVNYEVVNANIEILDAKLYIKGTSDVYKKITTDNLEFNDLLSNTNYDLEINYSYLLDGKSYSDCYKTKENYQGEIKTLELSSPNYSGTSFKPNNFNYVVIEITEEDIDNVLISRNIALYGNGQLIKDNLNLDDQVTLEQDYTSLEIRVTYVYNLNDGNPNITKTFVENILL